MSSQDQYHVTVSIDGDPIGVFDSRSGGATESDLTKRNTGEGVKVYKRMRADHGDVAVVRGYERERDHELARRLKPRVGRAAMVVSEQPLDDDGNAWGTPVVYSGVLNSVNTGDVDVNTGDPRDIELGMVCKAVD